MEFLIGILYIIVGFVIAVGYERFNENANKHRNEFYYTSIFILWPAFLVRNILLWAFTKLGKFGESPR